MVIQIYEVNYAANNGTTALIIAAGHGHIDIVRLLIEHNADVNAAGGLALTLATQKGYTDIVTVLRQHGAR